MPREQLLKMPMRIQVLLPGEDYDALKMLAEKQGVYLSVVVREAVRMYLRLTEGGTAKWA